LAEQPMPAAASDSIVNRQIFLVTLSILLTEQTYSHLSKQRASSFILKKQSQIKRQPFNNNTQHSATTSLKPHINILLFLCRFVVNLCVKLYAL